MNSLEETAKRSINGLRWSARILGAGLLFLNYDIGLQELNHLYILKFSVNSLFSSVFLIILLGLIIGFFWEFIGGIFIVGGCVIVALLAVITEVNNCNDLKECIIYYTPFLISGILYLFSWWTEGKEKK